MKENVKNNENNSRILKSNTKTSKQPPISEIIQSKKNIRKQASKMNRLRLIYLTRHCR